MVTYVLNAKGKDFLKEEKCVIGVKSNRPLKIPSPMRNGFVLHMRESVVGINSRQVLVVSGQSVYLIYNLNFTINETPAFL